MAIEQLDGALGVEQTKVLPKEEQQTPTQAENPEEADLSAVDVVTISPEAQDINARTAEDQNPGSAENRAEATRERDVEQRVQENQDNAARSDSQTPQRTNNVDEIV